MSSMFIIELYAKQVSFMLPSKQSPQILTLDFTPDSCPTFAIRRFAARRHPRQPKQRAIMYNGIGLSTPRGSGTNGYVQRNLGHVRKHPQKQATPLQDVRLYLGHEDQSADNLALRWQMERELKYEAREANAEILAHERKRAIEVKLMELRAQLEDDEVPEKEIAERVAARREELQKGDGAQDSKDSRTYVIVIDY